jgi:hypothetical protein
VVDELFSRVAQADSAVVASTPLLDALLPQLAALFPQLAEAIARLVSVRPGLVVLSPEVERVVTLLKDVAMSLGSPNETRG